MTSAVVTLVIMLITYFMTSLASYVSTASSSSLIALSALALVLVAIVYMFTKNLSVAFLTAAALVGAAADCLRHRRFGLLRPVPGADEEAVAV